MPIRYIIYLMFYHQQRLKRIPCYYIINSFAYIASSFPGFCYNETSLSCCQHQQRLEVTPRQDESRSSGMLVIMMAI